MSLNVRLSISIGRVKVGSGSSDSIDGIAFPHIEHDQCLHCCCVIISTHILVAT